MILIGYGDADYDAEVTVYAGDGDDLVDIHGDWHDYLINGGRGNDTFIVDGGFITGVDDVMKIDGGAGDERASTPNACHQWCLSRQSCWTGDKESST